MSQHDPEYGPDGVAYDGPPGGLEALLSAKPILSEPVTIEHGGESVTVVFRELSNDMKQRCRMHAIQHVEDSRRKQEDGGVGEWRDMDSDLDVLKGEETDLRMLQAAMLDPKTMGPACSLGWLRKRMGTQLQTKLGDHYQAFEALIDPAAVSPEMIEQVIDDVKKKMPPDYLLMQYGSHLLAKSLQFLVALVETSQTDKYFGSGSGETPP